MLRIRSAVWVAVVTMASGCFPYGAFNGVQGGVTGGWSNFPKFGQLVGDQPGIISYNSNPRTTSYGAFIEGRQQNWTYGTSALYGQHKFGQTFQSGDGRPDRTDGTVDGLFFGAYAGRRWPLTSRVGVNLFNGPIWTHNRAHYDWLVDDEVISDDRTHNGFSWQVGGSIDVDLTKSWGLRAGFDNVGFGRQDADNHTRGYLGLFRRFYRPDELRSRAPAPSGQPRARRGGA